MRHADTADRNLKPRAPQPAPLDDQYRAIGISAVAAAVRYRPEPRPAPRAPEFVREQD